MFQLMRLVFDTGLLVLIWIVQLVVYPSFRYYNDTNLLAWHQKYTYRITIVVLPLMLGELLVASLQLLYTFSIYSIVSLILIIIIWFNTFFQAIPLHQKIDNKINLKQSTKQLIQINWIRTILWTIIFVITCLQFL